MGSDFVGYGFIPDTTVVSSKDKQNNVCHRYVIPTLNTQAALAGYDYTLALITMSVPIFAVSLLPAAARRWCRGLR